MTLTPPIEPSDYEVDNSGSEFITLINCNRGKGVEMFAKIAAALPDKKFLAVLGGYGIQSAPIASNVTIWDIQSDIRKVYKVTRLLLMPSLYESWGRTASEAACSGIPVICNDTWGLRENLGDDGIYCSNFEQYIEAIKRMDEKKEYDKASAAIKKRAISPVKKLEELEKFMEKKITEHTKKKKHGI
jgi:glycosyltransferase involved in cell wall biosynthesis